jgi:hypothetical protein
VIGRASLRRELVVLLFMLLTASVALGSARSGRASAERAQAGDLIISLGGRISPLKLPRDHPAPVSVHLAGSLRTDDGSTLPRMVRMELGLPQQGVIDTRGLPLCSPRRLRSATTAGALEACGDALVGRGRLRADVVLPDQSPLSIDTRLLAFNARVDGRRALVVHAFGTGVPVAVVIPFLFEHRSGNLGQMLVAKLPRALGPWPRLANFEMTLSRSFEYKGRRHSYLSASCPIPKALTAGFFSLARAGFTIAGGGRIGTAITRGCRGR